MNPPDTRKVGHASSIHGNASSRELGLLRQRVACRNNRGPRVTVSPRGPAGMCVSQFVKVDFDQARVRYNWEEVDVGRVRLSGSIACTVVPKVH